MTDCQFYFEESGGDVNEGCFDQVHLGSGESQSFG